MSCLYAGDYGPPDPGFDALADGGRLIHGFEGQSALLARATSLGQLEAMERSLRRGDEIVWCDQGYGWAYGGAVHALFAAILVLVILPYAGWKLGKRLRSRLCGLAATRISVAPSGRERKIDA